VTRKLRDHGIKTALCMNIVIMIQNYNRIFSVTSKDLTAG